MVATTAALLLTGLLTAASAHAAFDCELRLDTVTLPGDATEVLRDETLRINDQPFCYVGFETDLPPAEVIDRQAAVWKQEGGQLFGPRPGSNDRPHTLFFAADGETRHLEAIREDESTAVTVSIMSATADELTPPPSSALPSGLRPLYEQRNRHGSTTVIDTAIAPAPALQRLTDHLRDRGWVLTSRAEGPLGLKTRSMHRREHRLEIGALPDGERTAMVVNRIRRGLSDE
ncbi:hypothetical protein [Spiribacter insolitus]|uniref:Uncharacterized protein n=1 Tax=Spiribacter insolitus TaxID=3122417 RepID=A0ABV3T631_9GAMM